MNEIYTNSRLGFSKRRASLTIFLIMLALLMLSLHTQAQAFQRSRGYSTYQPKGDDKQCKVVHHRLTIGQRLWNKVTYARKRHHSEMFNYRETGD